MMSFSQNILVDQGIIETTLLDGITDQELRAGIARALELSAERDINRFLVDASAASSFISLFSLYQLPELYSSLEFSRSSRIAVLSSRTQRGKDRARFFVNVCVNRGWQARLFYHRSEALEWLSSGGNES